MLLRTKVLPIILNIFFLASTAKSISLHRRRIPSRGDYSSSINLHDASTLPHEETHVSTPRPQPTKLISSNADLSKIPLIAYDPKKKTTTLMNAPNNHSTAATKVNSGIKRKSLAIAKQWGNQIVKFLRWRKRKHELDEECCPICLAGYQIDTDKTSVSKSENVAVMLRQMPDCRHHFHAECLETWLGNVVTCPICRGRAPIEKIAQGYHVGSVKLLNWWHW